MMGKYRFGFGARALGILVVVSALAASLVLTHIHAPRSLASGVTLTQLSSDPYTNTSSQHQTEVEPDTFSYGSTIVTAFQTGRFYTGGASNIGWATSTDGGTTWTHGVLTGTTVYEGGPWDRVSDASVAYDATHHIWMISSLTIQNGIGAAVLVSRSTDGGLTWGKPVTVSIAGTNSFYDKEWIVCDTRTVNPQLRIHSVPGFGSCYIEWDDSYLGRFYMSTSTDGGLSWSVPNGPSPNQAGIGGQPLILPNGTVVVPNINGAGNIGSFVSTNGGATWSNIVTVATLTSFVGNGNVRGGVLPSAEVDASGRVYVVWSDCRFEPNCEANDIVMSTSTDGLSWSSVQRIPIDPVGSNVDHYLASIAVDRSTGGTNAHLAVTFYYDPIPNCSTSTCQLYAGYVSSTNSGSTWSAETQLAGPMNVTWLANTNQGYMLGDYFSSSVVNGRVYPAIEVANVPNNGVFDEATYTVAGGLAVAGGSNSALGNRVVSTSSRRRSRAPRTAY